MKILQLGIWHRNDGIRLSEIRISRMPYVLAYVGQLWLYTILGQFLEKNQPLGPIGEYTIIRVVYFLCSLVAILLWNKHFKPQIRMWVAAAAIAFFPCILLEMSTAKIVFTILFYGAFGAICSCTRCGFAYATNNSEKIFSLIIMVVVDKYIRIIHALHWDNFFLKIILPIIVFIAMVISLLLYEEDKLEVIETTSDRDTKGLYWGLAYFIMYFWLSDNITTYPKNDVNMLKMSGIGTYLGILIFVLFIFILKWNSFHAWNIFFLFATMAYITKAFLPTANIGGLHYFSAGMMQFGWPLSLYLLACAQRRFADYKLLKKSTIIYVVMTPITQFGSLPIEHFFPEYYDIIRALFVFIVIFVVLMLSPYSNRYLFSNEWISQLTDPDMKVFTEAVEQTDEFEKWNLSPRQKEVAILLLAGKTRRQISGELQLSESTVKLHTSELYKKLNINSRIELFRIFGVSGNSGEDNSEES